MQAGQVRANNQRPVLWGAQEYDPDRDGDDDDGLRSPVAMSRSPPSSSAGGGGGGQGAPRGLPADVLLRKLAEQQAKAEAVKSKLNALEKTDSVRNSVLANVTIGAVEPYDATDHIRMGSREEAGAGAGEGGRGGAEGARGRERAVAEVAADKGQEAGGGPDGTAEEGGSATRAGVWARAGNPVAAVADTVDALATPATEKATTDSAGVPRDITIRMRFPSFSEPFAVAALWLLCILVCRVASLPLEPAASGHAASNNNQSLLETQLVRRAFAIPTLSEINAHYINDKMPTIFYSGLYGQSQYQERLAQLAHQVKGKLCEQSFRRDNKFPREKYTNKHQGMSDKEYKEFCERFSKVLAARAEGVAYVVFRDRTSVSSIFRQIEFPTLKKNPKIKKVVKIDFATGAQSNYWVASRGKSRGT
ncbi:hypothetical protein DFJ73DRAFT_804692 [Zopfochytrium polystomum]|nr:hypothetical protein DFJ73DRAFT_804692 [Zopfochytrium polystomum]